MDVDPQNWGPTFANFIQKKQCNEAEIFMSRLAVAVSNELTSSVIGEI